ncbi:MAG: cupredoxin domain-containing protein [Gemmatimonadales bacterium]
MHRAILRQTLVVGVALLLPAGAGGQSVLDRPPNLWGGWLGQSGTLQFNFVHRFGIGSAPLRDVTNSPTFLLSYPLSRSLALGFNYATSSDVAPTLPNEWEFFARAGAPLGPLAAAVQAGYNEAAQSVDGELSLAYEPAARLRLLAIGRVLSNGYDRDEVRGVIGGGATLRLSRYIALAGDVASLLDPEDNEKVAWGAGLQLAIPYTPHTLSLHVTNTNTATLQGVSRGLDRVRGGFEFTIPFTLSRYFGGGGRRTAAEGGEGGARAGEVAVSIAQMAFPAPITVSAGATVAWTNNDVVEHTVTAADGSWDSGLIAPGGTWRRRFERPGEYAYHCTPHPFMRGAVVVSEP